MVTARKESGFSKKAWAGRSFAISAAILSLLVCGHALAKDDAKEKTKPALSNQVMKYDVYAGGFHVVSSRLDVDLAKKSQYLLRLSAFTHGMLARLAPWKGVFETQGWYDVKKQFPQPRQHISNTTWRDEVEVTEFHYNKDGSFKQYRLTNHEEHGVKEPEPGIADGTIDVLTATLKVMTKVADGGACEGKDEIFDGSRRYALVFKDHGKVTLKGGDLNVYNGPANECTVEVKPIAGKWHEKPRGWMSIQEQGRERGTMPTVWLASVTPGAPAVPVKIRVKTEYGALFMHLTSYNGGGQTMTLAK